MMSAKHHSLAFSPSHKLLRTRYVVQSLLKATVFYPDDSANHEDSTASMMSQDVRYTNFNIFNEASLSQLADRLSHDPDKASALARIASAFSPPGYSIDLTNISGVRCLRVDNTRLDIEAVVCDNSECSSLLVPVDFPEVCTLEYELEECVLNNVYNLNKQGDRLIRDRFDAFADEEEAHKAYEVFKLVSGSDYLKPSPMKLPEWWIPPSSSEDFSECNMIEKLLNEADWQFEIRGLCRHAMLQESAGCSNDDQVQFARVKAIGPAGMVLEAHVSLEGKSVDDYGGVNNIAIVDVPIKFPLESSGRGATIRDHVLDIVSSVNAS